MTDPEKETVDKTVQFRGSCACGRISYQCTDALSSHETGACHCSICRKLSGGPFQAFTTVSGKSVILFDQKEHLRYEGFPKDNFGGIVYLRFSRIAERAFCVSCYSPLAMRHKYRPDTVDLNLSAIDDESIASEDAKSSLRLEFHLFTSQKVSWNPIEEDGVPQDQRYERFPQSFEDEIRAWEAKQASDEGLSG